VWFFRERFPLKQFNIFTFGCTPQDMTCIDLQEYRSSGLEYLRGMSTAFSVAVFFPVWPDPFRLVDFPLRTPKKFLNDDSFSYTGPNSWKLTRSMYHICWDEIYSSMPSSGMWHRVDLMWTDVSEERIASIFRVENPRARNQREQVAADWATRKIRQRGTSVSRWLQTEPPEKTASEEPAWAGGCTLSHQKNPRARNQREQVAAHWATSRLIFSQYWVTNRSSKFRHRHNINHRGQKKEIGWGEPRQKIILEWYLDRI
jgi:hypothetical protein